MQMMPQELTTRAGATLVKHDLRDFFVVQIFETEQAPTRIDIGDGFNIEDENVHYYFCCQPLPASYHQPRRALVTQRRANVSRISDCHSG